MTGHGGNIYQAVKKSGMPIERIIDFSASINPLGVPESAVAAIKRQIRNLPHYPEPFAESLSQHISRHFKIPPETIVCGNGSTELIYLLPKALRPGKVLVTAPAFSEYERACKGIQKSTIRILKLERRNNYNIDPEEFILGMSGTGVCSVRTARASRPCDMAFLCNPNNPTGRLLARKDVLKIAAAAQELKCYLVVDEAFIDFCPGTSVIREVRNNPYLVVLRSLTKFYALSGLRLGFGVFHKDIAGLVRQHKEPWTVNSLALEAGKAVLSDKAYQKLTLATVRAERIFLQRHFDKLSIDYIPSSSNYYLIRTNDAQSIVSALEKKGVLVRDCSNFNGLDNTCIRIAVRSRRENKILIRELSALCPVS